MVDLPRHAVFMYICYVIGGVPGSVGVLVEIGFGRRVERVD